MKRSILLTLTALVLVFSSQAKESKAVQKARLAVENAAPDDWWTLANSAEVLLQKNTSLKDVNEWLDKSTAIRETSYGMELRGDYYMAMNLPKKAVESYVRSIELGKKESTHYRPLNVQGKIKTAKAAI